VHRCLLCVVSAIDWIDESYTCIRLNECDLLICLQVADWEVND